jgi:hypothetical protein
MRCIPLILEKKKQFLSYCRRITAVKAGYYDYFKATMDIETEIADVANQSDYDLLLVGLGKSF